MKRGMVVRRMLCDEARSLMRHVLDSVHVRLCARRFFNECWVDSCLLDSGAPFVPKSQIDSPMPIFE